MKTLSSVQCGIKPLEGVLNRMVNGVNARTPIAGAGIMINESDGGVVIALAKKGDDESQNQVNPGGQGAASGPIALRLYDVSFFAAQVVDPTTCQTTFVQVLIQDPGGWTDFHAYIGAGAPAKWPG